MSVMIGKVYLIGAGPGDPGLLTIKGKECLEAADVVLYDRLIPEEILQYASRAIEKIYVGKARGNHHQTQEEINALLVKKALAGYTIARLKGGDPFVFGRGAEEAEALIAHNIPFEVVPGVTSAVGALAYAGIPVTHRNVAKGFRVITGHESLNFLEGPGTASHSQETLVILMGLAHLGEIAARLMALGRAAKTPVAVVGSGTTHAQKVVIGKLDSIEDQVLASNLQSPAIIVVGDVVQMAEKLAWFRPDASPWNNENEVEEHQ